MQGASADMTSPETVAVADAMHDSLVFVFGGSSGIGEAVARMAAANGARVAIAGRSEERLAAISKALGAQSAGYHCLDMGDEDTIREALQSHGAIDHIVITAASMTLKPADQLQHAEVEAMLVSKFPAMGV